ncbi:M23 family metallopeptidase [Pseudarthrobacter sp. C4D7]|uniref:M23 family metallopeptidase n=1 Tax=Pseudarthrobacter sp. C4D7 TaxID=2735268 RepID=UPI001584B8CB|nr:M23 family metallopeptidase [Pseudarthrobacter sp. C4D7]NUT71420.1 M23 family metallopeptidase [Pseudarthrobacter sp. C4D7]
MIPADPVDLAYPFSGTWLVQNSPADRVPSHGTRLFATAFAIDFTPVDSSGQSAPVTMAALFRPGPPEQFAGFGRPVTAPVAGLVRAVRDGEPDHAAFRGFPSIGYALTQARRVREGWLGLAGNHVIIQSGNAFIALCHLQRGSVCVQRDQLVRPGEPVGSCGNSGNSTEPHVHVQAMDSADPGQAAAVPIVFPDGLPRNGTVVFA